ncbi:MAG TPA: MerR family transcriptional regulator [bacterium]|nr:MerR family transcriptional regulator [bacterium]
MKERTPHTPVYVISIAADLTGCHPRTLRIYEERGLVAPTRRHRIRLYSELDIQRVRLIRFLTEERGLNLAGVRLLLEIQEHYHEELTWVYDGGQPDRETRRPAHEPQATSTSAREKNHRPQGGRGR